MATDNSLAPSNFELVNNERDVLALRNKEIIYHKLGQTKQAVSPNDIVGAYQAFLWSYLCGLDGLIKENPVSDYQGLTIDEVYNAMTNKDTLELIVKSYEKHYLPIEHWSQYLYDDNHQQQGYFSSLIHSSLFLKNVFYDLLEKEINWIYRAMQVKALQDIYKDRSDLQKITLAFMSSLTGDWVQWQGVGDYVNRLIHLSVQQNEVSLLCFLFDDVPLNEQDINNLGEILLQSARKISNRHTQLYIKEAFYEQS